MEGFKVGGQIAGINIPDSRLAVEATELSLESSPKFLFNHCLRTFIFGSKAGKKLSIRYDPELFYVISILHDLGLTKRFEWDERFEVVGADAAKTFCLERGVPPEKVETVWDAIALHSTSGIAQRKGSEIALVQIGAGIDVFGFGAKDLGMAEIRQVITEVSREGFGRKAVDLFADLGRRKPRQHTRTFVGEIALEMGAVPDPTPSTEILFNWAAEVESSGGAEKP